ncbi:MAG: indole-3-glycerol-phosphate synthase, partial [Methanobacteriota archaeon]
MILDEILAAAAVRASLIDVASLPPPPRRDVRSLRRAIRAVQGKVPIIAELKPASPIGGAFRGAIRDPVALASDLVAGGCAGLSVVSEPEFFGGSLETLGRIARIAPVPVLRKDFIVDERQIPETRSIGADAILLIARVLGDRLPAFVDQAIAAGLEPLVEVHTPGETAMALATQAPLLGINNRDLSTMTVDLDTTWRIAPLFGT